MEQLRVRCEEPQRQRRYSPDKMATGGPGKHLPVTRQCVWPPDLLCPRKLPQSRERYSCGASDAATSTPKGRATEPARRDTPAFPDHDNLSLRI